MNKKLLNSLSGAFAIFGLLILNACTSSMELEDGDYTGEEPIASTEGGEMAPADAVPPEEGVAPTEVTPDLEVANNAAAGDPASGAPVADATAPANEELPPPADLITDPASQAVAVKELPPPADVNGAPPAPAPVVVTETPPSPVVETPVAEASPMVSSSSGDAFAYTVQKGDTLMKISWEQYGDLFRWREIYSLNKEKIADPNAVPPGTVLQIAGQGRSPASAMEHNGEQYLIVFGDTLGKISGKVYGDMQKWRKIWENNKRLIRDPNKIYAGFFLYYVPESKMTSTEEASTDTDSSES